MRKYQSNRVLSITRPTSSTQPLFDHDLELRKHRVANLVHFIHLCGGCASDLTIATYRSLCSFYGTCFHAVVRISKRLPWSGSSHANDHRGRCQERLQAPRRCCPGPQSSQDLPIIERQARQKCRCPPRALHDAAIYLGDTSSNGPNPAIQFRSL